MGSRHSETRACIVVIVIVAVIVAGMLLFHAIDCGTKVETKPTTKVPVTVKEHEARYADEVSTVRLDQMETKSDMVATLYNALVPFYPSIAPSAVEVAFNTKGDSRAMYIENDVAYPPAVTDAGNKALDGKSSTDDDEDVYLENSTGTDLGTLCEYVEDTGYPVIIWVTSTYEKPTHATYEEHEYDITEYDNPHTVIVTGRDDQDVHLSDALNGDMTVSFDMLDDLYDACGRQSVTFKE